MKRIMSLCVAFALMCTTLGYGQEAIALKKDESAPFDGILVSSHRIEELIQSEIERDELKIKYETLQKIKKIEQGAYEDALRSNKKWYKNPQVNRAAGFLLGVLFTGLAVYGAGQLD